MKSKREVFTFVLDLIFLTFSIAFVVILILGTFKESRMLILVSRLTLTVGVGSILISRIVRYVHGLQ